MTRSAEYKFVYQSAIRLAVEAGRLLKFRMGQVNEVAFKGEIDLVTEVDKASEALIAAGIAAAHPAHALLGEEGSTTGVDPETADWVWIVDPIDGTTNFAHGYPHFAVSIAVVHEGVGELGVIYDPSRDELFAGKRNGGATLNGKPMAVSTVSSLRRSLLGTGFSYDFRLRESQNAIWTYLHTRCQGIRREGSAALGVAWVAAGRMDGFYEQPINPWDISAGAIIGAAAGARVTRMDGSAYDVFDLELVISNGLIHDELVESIGLAQIGVGAIAD